MESSRIKQGKEPSQQGKEFGGDSCYRFLSCQSRSTGVEEVLGNNRQLVHHTAGGGRRLVGQLHGGTCVTFFSLWGNKFPGLSSLIWVSI